MCGIGSAGQGPAGQVLLAPHQPAELLRDQGGGGHTPPLHPSPHSLHHNLRCIRNNSELPYTICVDLPPGRSDQGNGD
jgi:hypothetical protein